MNSVTLFSGGTGLLMYFTSLEAVKLFENWSKTPCHNQMPNTKGCGCVIQS